MTMPFVIKEVSGKGVGVRGHEVTYCSGFDTHALIILVTVLTFHPCTKYTHTHTQYKYIYYMNDLHVYNYNVLGSNTSFT